METALRKGVGAADDRSSGRGPAAAPNARRDARSRRLSRRPPTPRPFDRSRTRTAAEDRSRSPGRRARLGDPSPSGMSCRAPACRRRSSGRWRTAAMCRVRRVRSRVFAPCSSIPALVLSQSLRPSTGPETMPVLRRSRVTRGEGVNLTITIEDDVLKTARHRALEENASVNAVVREHLEEYAGLRRRRA